ncbi:type II toxin-antitoxin system prevent-host-death family antitoxin [Candidatus Bipolaricaulota bacterium]|nr:type II toxin-antitoxin system prevent-host-death family antitoxin [Candidatus Bipolaricaulota bacterium]
MEKTISITEVKNRLTQLVREVEGGLEITVTRGDRPVVMLIAIEEYRALKRQVAASRLRELRKEFVKTGVRAEEIHRKSRELLEERS